MKKTKLPFTAFFLFLVTFGVAAQSGVSKDELLRGLNGFNEIGLSDIKSTELQNYNENYANKLYDVIDSDRSEKDKIDGIKTISQGAAKDLEDILGLDNFKKYKKTLKKNLKPLKRKSKLLKYII
ncbi:hypothetical protein [Namhaeicola litoreus]|uniref:Uncharacterized protein n=1 Tax=Namhaeicola litoreus TaxID=1052145 RepID=A0ABW3Y4E7_9FLAO